jgi:hypothetical protein
MIVAYNLKGNIEILDYDFLLIKFFNQNHNNGRANKRSSSTKPRKAQIKVNKTKITLGWLGFPIMILLDPFL